MSATCSRPGCRRLVIRRKGESPSKFQKRTLCGATCAKIVGARRFNGRMA